MEGEEKKKQFRILYFVLKLCVRYRERERERERERWVKNAHIEQWFVAISRVYGSKMMRKRTE